MLEQPDILKQKLILLVEVMFSLYVDFSREGLSGAQRLEGLVLTLTNPGTLAKSF